MDNKDPLVKTKFWLNTICLFLAFQPHQSHSFDRTDVKEKGELIQPLQKNILPQYFDQQYIDKIEHLGMTQVNKTNTSLMDIEESVARYWSDQLSAFDCIKATNVSINELLVDSSQISGLRGGPNVHIFFKLFSQLIPQYRKIFQKEFRLPRPQNILNDLKEDIKKNNDSDNSAILKQLDKLQNLKGQNSSELIEILWESWQLAKFIDTTTGNLNRQYEFKDKIQNSELYGINLNQGFGDAKRSRIFLYFYMVLLEDGLKARDSQSIKSDQVP